MQYSLTRVKSSTYRAISTQYPPIDLFENLCSPSEYEQACEWEMLTSERIRNTRIPHEKCVFGAGASFVMAPFFYKTPAARFSSDLFGGYYASKYEATAIYEKAYHLGKFISSTENEPFSEGLKLQILKGNIDTSLHDLTNLDDSHPIYNKNSYMDSQQTATQLHDDDSNGIIYSSVRNEDNQCFVIFKPKKVKIPIVTKKIPLHFDGEKIDKYFDDEIWNIL
jgi:hypothetical protein